MKESDSNINKETDNKDKTIVKSSESKSVVNDVFMEDLYRDNYIDLYKLEGLDSKDQSKVFTLLLSNIYKEYTDIDYGEIRKLSLKCLKLSCDSEESELRLPKKLLVSKDTNRMYFAFENDKTKVIIWILVGLFLVLALAATYFGLRYLSLEHLNIDINDDGVADLNIDISGNEIAEVNISKDNKTPSSNIDYKGNRNATFNVIGSDNKVYNKTNQDNDNDGKCDINCDTNGDGWPETNIDLTGSGKATLFLDRNNDGVPDMNFDTTGDGVCDVHCDTDGDNVCDKYCIVDVSSMEDITGSSAVVGNESITAESASFVVDFVDSEEIKATDLVPENQAVVDPGVNYLTHVSKTFTVENKSQFYVQYKVEMVVDVNQYVAVGSENFVYNYTVKQDGYEDVVSDYSKVPGSTDAIISSIVIPPKSKQSITLDFKIKGINGAQNYDQGKIFRGKLQLYVLSQSKNQIE